MKTSLVCLVEIIAPHGVRGDVRVKSFTDKPENLKNYSLLVNDTQSHQFHIESLKVTPKGIIVHFKGIDDRTTAEKLRGLCLYVERTRLPVIEPEQYYHTDLIDMLILNEKGDTLGKVIAVHNFGAGDIIEFIGSDSKPICIPFTKDFVADVDLQNRVIVVKSIEGFYY